MLAISMPITDLLGFLGFVEEFLDSEAEREHTDVKQYVNC